MTDATKPAPDAARQRLIEKIQKLARLAESAGATEAEALLAGERMAALIAAYNVTQDELSIRRDAAGCLMDSMYIHSIAKEEWQFVFGAVGGLYACKGFRSMVEIEDEATGLLERCIVIQFYGMPQDVAAAKAFMHLISLACMSQIHAYNTVKGRRRPQRTNSELHSFHVGLYERLSARIRDLAPRVALSNGRGLISLKNQLVDDQFGIWAAANNFKVLPSRGIAPPTNYTALAAGQAAANRIDLQQTRVQRPLISR